MVVPKVRATHSRKRATFKASVPAMGSASSETRKMISSQIGQMNCMLSTNEPVTKYSARLIRKQMLAAGGLNKADRMYLKHMIEEGQLLDDESFYILLNLLLTAPRQ
jgi:hypothetical protein